jgi:hypothetical protein
MNQNEEVPENLGGHGDLLPADVLKMVNFFNEPDEQSGTCSDSAMARKSRMKFNELLEQLHRKDKDHQGSTVINIYGKGSLHVDHVDNQYLYGDKWVKALQNKVVADDQPSAEPVFEKDTPLSALFRDNFHGELRKVIESWRPYLIDDDANVDAMKMHSFHFDFSKVIATSIYIDLGRLLHTHALKDDNMSSLAQYLYRHSNLSNSQSTLYAQLRKYKKR